MKHKPITLKVWSKCKKYWTIIAAAIIGIVGEPYELSYDLKRKGFVIRRSSIVRVTHANLKINLDQSRGMLRTNFSNVVDTKKLTKSKAAELERLQ
jgi:hypothetical protein